MLLGRQLVSVSIEGAYASNRGNVSLTTPDIPTRFSSVFYRSQ